MNRELTVHLDYVSRWISDCNAKPWLLLLGGVGNGKTTLALALHKYIDETVNYFYDKSGRKNKALTTYMIKAKDLYKLYREDLDQFNELMEVDILTIDDLGVEPKEGIEFGNVTTPIADLLDYRYGRRLMTIMTTNLDGPEISKHYGDRIHDRLREMALQLFFLAHSFRGQNEQAVVVK